MRDAHRMREKYDLSLDSRQVVSLLIGGIVVLGAVFVLGVLVGKKLAGTPRSDRAPDLLTALDHKSDALERARAAPPLTFQEELTRPTPAPPTVPRTAAPSPAPTSAGTAATPAVVRAPAPAPAAAPPAAATNAGATDGTSGPGGKAASQRRAAAVATTTIGAADPKPEKKAEPEKKQEPARPAHAESVATRSAPAAASSAPKVPETTSPTGAFTLQLGASPSRDDAERQASRLREKGYAPYIVAAEVPGKGTWYRVRMGSFPTKDAATRYLQDFR